MTSPWGNPPPLPNPPRTWPATAITVQLKSCCGLLVGDLCDCAAFMGEVLDAFDAPIVLPPVGPVLTDPALNVWRPGPDMVEAMAPPTRWHVTTEGVEVGL